MSDVILYAALKENQRLNSELLNLCLGSTAITLESYAVGAINPGTPYAASATGNPCIPQIVSNWTSTLTPYVEERALGLKVCDASGQFRCGATCNWVVPTGVTSVQFQLWGPGSGTSSNCCCGGSPFGASGAYAVVKMNVTPGHTYCLCAGCAFCCYATQTTPGICGTPSWVRGCGICVCADSGISCYDHWSGDIGADGFGQSAAGCGVPYFDGCSVSACSGGYNFCWDTADDDTDICHAFSRQTWYLPCANAACNVEAYGLNGMWPRMTIGGNLQTGTYSVSPPVFGFENATCCLVFSGSTCAGCNRRASNGIQQGPAFGGFASMVFGGCSACGGDAGGMGMICVSYTCN